MLVIVRIFSTSKTKLGVEVQCQERKRLQPLIQRSGRVFNARLEKCKNIDHTRARTGDLVGDSAHIYVNDT